LPATGHCSARGRRTCTRAVNGELCSFGVSVSPDSARGLHQQRLHGCRPIGGGGNCPHWHSGRQRTQGAAVARCCSDAANKMGRRHVHRPALTIQVTQMSRVRIVWLFGREGDERAVCAEQVQATVLGATRVSGSDGCFLGRPDSDPVVGAVSARPAGPRCS
jgi:hypothetical protein